MPNYVHNYLYLHIPNPVSRRKFLAEIAGEKRCIDFEKIIPPPADMFRGNLGEAERRECAEKGVPTWLDWQTKNWGTKWNSLEPNVNIKKDGLLIRFQTAWQPPYPVIAKLFTAQPYEMYFWAACEGGIFAINRRKYIGEGEVSDSDFEDADPGDIYDLMNLINQFLK